MADVEAVLVNLDEPKHAEWEVLAAIVPRACTKARWTFHVRGNPAHFACTELATSCQFDGAARRLQVRSYPARAWRNFTTGLASWSNGVSTVTLVDKQVNVRS